MNKVSTAAIQRCVLSGVFCSSLAWGACKVFRAQSKIKLRSAPFVVLGFLGGGLIPLQYTSKHMVVSLMRLDSQLGDETRRIFQEHAPDSPFLEAVKSKALKERAERVGEENSFSSSLSSSNVDDSSTVFEDAPSTSFTSNEYAGLNDHEKKLFKE